MLVLLKPVTWEKTDFSLLYHLPSTKVPVSSWDNIDEAFSDIAQGIRLLLKQVWLLRGNTYSEEHKLDLALYAFGEASHLDESFGMAYIFKGNVQRAMGLHTESQESFKKALERGPTDEEIHREIGISQYKAEEYSQAISSLNQAIKFNRFSTLSYLYKGLTLEKLERPREALEVYTHYLAIQKDDPVVTPHQARLLVSLGESGYSNSIKNVSSDVASLFSQLAYSRSYSSSEELEPLTLFFESIYRLTVELPSLLEKTMVYIQQRIATMEEARSVLHNSSRNIPNAEETTRSQLLSLVTREQVSVENQIAPMKEILEGIRYMTSLPISDVSDIAARLLQGLQQLSQIMLVERQERQKRQIQSEQLLEELHRFLFGLTATARTPWEVP